MENVIKLLRTSFYVIVFFLGITFLFVMAERYHDSIDKSADRIADDPTLYEAAPADKHDTSRAELIALLMEDIQYDITISDTSGTYSLEAMNYNPGNLTSVTLTCDLYEKSYLYDEGGRIQTIQFIYIEGE